MNSVVTVLLFKAGFFFLFFVFFSLTLSCLEYLGKQIRQLSEGCISVGGLKIGLIDFAKAQ